MLVLHPIKIIKSRCLDKRITCTMSSKVVERIRGILDIKNNMLIAKIVLESKHLLLKILELESVWLLCETLL